MKYTIKVEIVRYGDDGTVETTGAETRNCELTDKQLMQVLKGVRKFLDSLPDSCEEPSA